MQQDLNQPILPLDPDAQQPETIPVNDGPLAEPTVTIGHTLTEASALTAARLLELLSQAEERGYQRARREMQPAGPREVPMWGDPRRIEAEEYAERHKVKLAGEFLSCVRPAVWD